MTLSQRLKKDISFMFNYTLELPSMSKILELPSVTAISAYFKIDRIQWMVSQKFSRIYI